MNLRALIGILALLLHAAIGDVLAADPTTVEQQLEQFVRNRAYDAKLLIRGPEQPHEVQIPAALSCAALYERRISLQRQLNDYAPSYWDDRRNQTATFIGTLWTPGFYFLPYSAITTHLSELSDAVPQVEIDALRRASAAQRCFEK